MALLTWQDDLNTGIEVIDDQHRRIVSMINQLHQAQARGVALVVADVIDELVDYTLSHFAFEEELMEEAGYPFCAAHRRVHEVFTKRVSEYRLRFQAGEDVVDELKSMLSRWLFNHIRNDDKGFIEAVSMYQKARAASLPRAQRRGWFTRLVDSLTGTSPSIR